MRIAVLDPSNFTPPYDAYLCNALSGLGHRVELYMRPFRSNEFLPKEGFLVREHFYRWSERLRKLPVLGILHPYVKGIEHIIDMFRLLLAIRRDRPDVIHVQWLSVPIIDKFFITRLKRLAPVILTVHDTNAFHGNPTSNIQLLGWAKALAAFNHLIVHTEHSREQLAKAGISGSRVSVIPHGMFEGAEPQHFGVNEVLINAVNAAPKQILFFGNIKPYKGVDVLLEAFAQLSQDMRTKVRLILAGKSYLEKDALQEQAKRLGIENSVTFDLRFIPDDDLVKLLTSAYMVVFPYRDIDASGALMTALPFGRPIIASRLGMFSEMLEDGLHGILVTPNDTKELTNAMMRLLEDEDLAMRIGEQAQKRAMQVSSWREIAESTVMVYENAASAA